MISYKDLAIALNCPCDECADNQHGVYRFSTGCRCDICVTVNAAYRTEKQAERRQRELPADVRHNASTYINWGCRCDVCSADHRVKCQVQAAKRKIRAREQALAA